ncbi:MAG: fibronectin type III domain-containing protein [Bacteroidales bacterium]|nr:fibronectin type III domain-containing protein [Bacteroidales bacterium]
MTKQKITYYGLLLILGLFVSFQANAQVYPVQLNTQLIPPYSLRLSDYTAPGTNRIGVNMLLTDLNEPEYYVRLELTIEGNGITIKTSPSFNPGPIILQGGVPQYFTSSDLTEWFEPRNLDFSGYSKSDYLATGRLPEGVYRFSFRAYDYNKGVRVSNNTPITAWLLLNDPPIINLPFPDHKVEHIDPQNIVFQWTPRHTGSPNSAFSTEYEFTLVEIWPEGRNPNDAILTGIPIYQTTTTQTTLVYGLMEPFLEPGRQYAYRIQARDIDERDMFKNNGYSEVRMFTFGEECKLVNNVEAKAEKYYEAEISWQPAFTQTEFNVRYRKANYSGAEWFEEDTYIDHVKITDLQELTEYEYQVMAYCGTYEGDYTDIKTFTTPAPKVSSFECGAADDVSGITNREPLPALRKGDYIWSGNFKFKIIEATGSNGNFSGKAYAMVPYLSFVKLVAEFNNIKVNTDNQVYDGEITSVYNPDSPFFITIGDGDDDDDDDDDGDGTDTDTEISDTTFTTDIDSVYIDDDVIIIVTEDGTDTIHTTDDIIIIDEDGDTWTVEDGEVIVGGGGGPGGGGGDPTDVPIVNDDTEIKIKIEFQHYDSQNYGYDKLTYDVHKPMYEQMSIYDETQYVPWKSLASAGTDQILVKYTDYDTIIKPDHVKFRTAAGIELTATKHEGNNDLRLLNITGKTNEETEGIEAYLPYKDTSDTEKEKLLGKLNTISYDKQNINLVIVPVNGSAGFSATEFTNALNDIYKQSVVNWTVTLDNKFDIDQEDWDKDDDSKMNDGESTLLSNYSDEQNKLRRKYKNSPGIDIDKNAYYVFLLNGIKSKSGYAGYMPLKEQYAFIYDGNANAKTIAHELGHGAFRLWHTFSSESNYYMAEKSSDNLMDYNNGDRLHKYQWDFIHDPEGGFYMFQDESEAAMIDILSLLSDIRQANLDEQGIYEITKDQCPEVGYKDVTIGDDKLSYLGIKCTDDFEPTEEEQQNVDFVDWQLEYGEKIKIMPDKKNKVLFESTLGNAIRYKFYEAIEHDPPMVNEQSNNKLFELLILENEAQSFEKYLFPTSRDKIISDVLDEMEEYLEHNYEQESDTLRTGSSEEALENMDCSEFVSRYLEKVCGLDEVPVIVTSTLLDYSEGIQNEYLEYIEGSGDLDYKDIEAGDVFLWRTSSGGHTGVVVSYDKSTDKVLIIESIGTSGARSPEEGNCINDGYCDCKGCVRKSLYSRTGKALIDHPGWVGYFRPIVK